MSYLIYDLDGTLAKSSREITNEMLEKLEWLKDRSFKNVIVSGGTYKKIKWQLQNRTDLFDMIFSECGAVMHKDDQMIYTKRVTDLIDKELLGKITKLFLNICNNIGFSYEGNRVDVRNGLIYLTPVGMKANDKLRSEFIDYEATGGFRDSLIPKLKQFDINNDVEIVKGGKTGVSVYPKGVNKTQMLCHIPENKMIYFFGDNCQEDGNDRCLYVHPRCNGHEVRDPSHTLELLDLIG